MVVLEYWLVFYNYIDSFCRFRHVAVDVDLSDLVGLGLVYRVSQHRILVFSSETFKLSKPDIS